MNTRPLTPSGPQLSELGFGTGPLGGDWGPQSDEDSVAALHRAIGLGLNFIDTAAGHGDGHSERLVASVVNTRDEEVFVATNVPPDAGPWPPSPYCRWQDRYPAAYLRENVEQRLRNLDTDCLDLLQLHSWTRAWNDDPQPLLVLRQLREEGKLRWIGVSAPEQDQDCVVQLMRDGLVDVVQVMFNLFHQEPAAQLLPVAAESETGVIARVTLDEGILTGKYPADHRFEENDFRRAYFSGDRLGRAVSRVREIEEDIERFGLAEHFTPADVALQFVLARPEVTTAVVGMRNPQQVERNVRSGSLPRLPAEMLEHLRRHNWRRGVWYGGK